MGGGGATKHAQLIGPRKTRKKVSLRVTNSNMGGCMNPRTCRR